MPFTNFDLNKKSAIPLQITRGKMYFRFLELCCEKGCFITRPETEWMVDDVLKIISQLKNNNVANAQDNEAIRVVDLCTGSGAIAISLATEKRDLDVYAVELSYSAY